MVEVRKYHNEDLNDIQITGEGLKDLKDVVWSDLESKLDNGITRTVVDNKGIKSIFSAIRCDDGTLFCYYIRDKRMSTAFEKTVKKIVKKAVKTGRVLFTLSYSGQDKMHEFLGFKKIKQVGDRELWVAS